MEKITLSQFATSYRKCEKLPEKYTLIDNVTNETGCIKDHLTEDPLPLFIKLSTNEIYRLRKFSTVLRIHSSSKKDGEEEYFAEMQLFSPWRTQNLDLWRKNCVEEFQERKSVINIVRKKTFPF